MSLFNDLPTSVNISLQIECVERELKMRRRLYPKWVAKGTMTEAKSKAEINRMEAVLRTLQYVKGSQDE